MDRILSGWKHARMGWCLLCTGLVLAGWTSLAAADDGFCWKGSYGRGVGTIPETCPAGKERIGLLCYDQCPAGTRRFGFDCHSVCPAGFRDDGLFCRKAEYGRGFGYALWDGPKCNQENPQGCEQCILMMYPRCAPGYEPVGCNICRPKVPNCEALGLNPGIDLSCAKKVLIGQPTPGTCGGREYDAGLCYDQCSAGMDGVGPVCWGECPSSHPVGCGMGCAESHDACAQAITDQVVSVVESVASIASMVATAGGSAAATTSAKVGGRLSGNVSKATVKNVLKDVAKEAGESIAEGALDAYAEATVQAGTTGEFDPWVLASLDPTGIASVVEAYAKPLCSDADSGNDVTAVSSGNKYPRPTKGGWTGFSPAWSSNRPVDAVVHIPDNNKVYTFSGDEYVRHTFGKGPDAGYPRKIQGGWSGWPSAWAADRGIDAVIYVSDNRKVYTFSGDEYVRHTFGKGPDAGYPRKIQGGWSGWPSAWAADRGIDAIVYVPENKKIYTFSGDEYVRHTFGQGPDAGYPVKTYLGWTGFPSSWAPTRPLDAAVYVPNGKVYAFSGSDYVRNSFGSGPD